MATGFCAHEVGVSEARAREAEAARAAAEERFHAMVGLY
jgi:hypothetical protein